MTETAVAPHTATMTRRSLLSMIGSVAGSAAMYQAMASLGHAAESSYTGPLKLDGDPKGATVLVLGAGLAGLVAAYELSRAGYKVRVLEYHARAGGRNWTLRGGDTYTELGGATQTCAFDPGFYINPGPWRLPYHHRAILDYCKRLGVALEPFIQVNHNAYLHSKSAFGGRPQRFRHVYSDFQGGVTELLAKAVQQDRLDDPVSKEDKQILLAALRQWGALDKDYRYVKGEASSDRRGYERDPGGGLSGVPEPSAPIALKDIVTSRLWARMHTGNVYEFHSAIFQPVGGMDMISRAFVREIGPLITHNAKVTAIHQDERGVTATYVDAQTGGTPRTIGADWCICTIPLSVLSQIEINVSPKMQAAIAAPAYGASVKIGLQFKRRFWEEDEQIYGGITYTDLPNAIIQYPSTDYFTGGKGVLLGAYAFGTNAFEWTALAPEERVKQAVAFGTQIHPQYEKEFENGIAVGWHREPATLGCFAMWSEAARKQHYDNLCALDGRILLAGEHASYLPAWQEGAVLSSLDAIGRLHRRVTNG
jgi:monoamine oxidase